MPNTPLNTPSPGDHGSDAPSMELMYHSAELAANATAQQLEEFRGLTITINELEQRRRLGAITLRAARPFVCDAQRRMGQILENTERATGVRLNGKDSLGGTRVVPPTDAPTLADLGISKKLSVRSKLLAKLPDEMYEAVRNSTKTFSQAQKEYRLLVRGATPCEEDAHTFQRQQRAIMSTNLAIAKLSSRMKHLLHFPLGSTQNKQQLRQSRQLLALLRARLVTLLGHVDEALLHLDGSATTNSEHHAA